MVVRQKEVKEDLKNLGVLVPESWLQKLDFLAQKLGYANRTEYVRDILRKEMRRYSLIEAIDETDIKRLGG